MRPSSRCPVWLLFATLALTNACASRQQQPAASPPDPGSEICHRNAVERAVAVREQSGDFEICAQLADPDAGGEYVLGFVATPSGEPRSVIVLGADFEPLHGEAPACFATVVRAVGLAHSGGGECTVTAPLSLPTRVARDLQPTRARDGWLAWLGD